MVAITSIFNLIRIPIDSCCRFACTTTLYYISSNAKLPLIYCHQNSHFFFFFLKLPLPVLQRLLKLLLSSIKSINQTHDELMICVLMKQLEMVDSIIATAVVILRHSIKLASTSFSVRFFSLSLSFISDAVFSSDGSEITTYESL